MVFLARLTLLVALLAGAAAAQTPANGASGSGAAETGAAGPSAAARALIEALRDERAREALIAELESLSSAPPASAAEGAPPHAAARIAEAEAQAAAPHHVTVGALLAQGSIDLVQKARVSVTEFANGLSATWRRLSALSGDRGGALVVALIDLVSIFAVTATLFLALRVAANWAVGRLDAAAAEAPPGRRTVLYAGTLIAHLAPVALAWVAGYVVALAFLGAPGSVKLNHSLYLNAFLIVELWKTALRAVLQPRAPRLRLAPMTDAGAHAWRRRLSLMASLLGYGLLVVVPLVNQTVSIFTGRAVGVIVHVLVLGLAMALVIRHRRDPLNWLRSREAAQNGDTALRVLKGVASVWHWPALAWLLVVFFAAVTQSGRVGPILIDSARVVGVLGAGVALHALLGRLARRGITVPESVGAQAPMFEERINGFMRRVVGVARLSALAVATGVALQVSGAAPVTSLMARFLGEDFGARLASVAIVVTGASALWIALASWVDYKLNPDRAVAATARERTLLTLLRNATTVALAVVTLMIALSEIGLDIGPLLASAGVLGLAVGFGSQRLVQDIITGVFIQLENAINVGDVITVSGTTGVVEKLTIRSVALRDLTGTFHIIPFSSVDMVSNFMRGFAFHVADIGVAYREDVGEAKRLMHEAFDDLRKDPDHARELIGPLEWHGLTEFGDSAVMLRARLRTRPGSQWAIGRAYNEAVKRRFDAAGVEIPFPHMTVWFGEDKAGVAPPMRVAPATAATAAALATAASAAPAGERPAQDAPVEADETA
jgi:small conductance mechanosensitive channel